MDVKLAHRPSIFFTKSFHHSLFLYIFLFLGFVFVCFGDNCDKILIRALLSLRPSVAIAVQQLSQLFAAVPFNGGRRYSLFIVNRSVGIWLFLLLLLLLLLLLMFSLLVFHINLHQNDGVKVAAAANVSLPSGEIGIARI